MVILRSDSNLPWLPKPHHVKLVLSDQFPPLPLITSAHAFVFDGDRLLMTNLHARGWTIPGGHREAPESPEETMNREVWEEAGARVDHGRLMAVQHIRLLGTVPQGYKYPHPDSYQVFFIARLASLEPFQGTAETRGRRLYSPAEARQIPWVQRNHRLYEAALSIASGTVATTAPR